MNFILVTSMYFYLVAGRRIREHTLYTRVESIKWYKKDQLVKFVDQNGNLIWGLLSRAIMILVFLCELNYIWQPQITSPACFFNLQFCLDYGFKSFSLTPNLGETIQSDQHGV